MADGWTASCGTGSGAAGHRTLEHPFYVIEKGWVKVKDLETGDKVKTLSGMELVMEYHIHKEKMNVFNIEVMGNHDYFVTQRKILVHNKYIHSETIIEANSDKNATFIFRIKYLIKKILKIK